MSVVRRSARVLTALLTAGCAARSAPPTSPAPAAPAAPAAAHAHGAEAKAGPPPLFTNLGSYRRPISTESTQAQAYFDQGLRLVYSFNHYEGLASFREAARLDPECAICHWGIALSLGSNYNSPTDAEREREAYAAVQRALALADGASPAERALIEATAQRHAAEPPADRKPLDEAYSRALRAAADRFPADPDIATLAADALMNLRPWDLWQADGTPYEGTLELVATLERVLAANPDHPGANHLYVHAVEASPDPGRAEAAADRLRGMVPGVGHMEHMPSHIYLRIGRYADSEEVNLKAVAADRAYFERREPSMIYRGMYYPHNIDFVWQSAAMSGRSTETLRAARELRSEMPVEMIAAMSDAEVAPAAPLYALARFGKWDEILAEPRPPADWLYTVGIWHYARGLALLRTGRASEAEAELAALRAHRERVPAERTYAGYFKTRDMLQLAADVLAGELASQADRHDEAIASLRAAVAAQDGHWFTEPPPWYFPVRQALGAALLAAGRPAMAESVYRDDLRRNPKNGWSLYGLAQALRAQGRNDEAAAVDSEFRAAWARADVELTASRF
jgi:hypothetical protein